MTEINSNVEINFDNQEIKEVIIEEIKQELEIEKVEVNDNNTILKVFVYNTDGEKVKEDFYANFVEIYDYVLEHNLDEPENPYNIYPGSQFPPKGYKWSKDVGDWVELNLFEKWQNGELEIPNDCKIVNNIIVRKNLTDLYEEGVLTIPPTKKIDKDFNLIVDKSEQELIDDGLIEWEMIYARLYNDFKIKLDTYLDLYYFKYPKSISIFFKEKVEMAKKWIASTKKMREKEKAFSFSNFQLLVSEINSKKYLTIDDLELELTTLSNKIIEKNNEIEDKLGKINILFNSLYEEIKVLNDKRNYLELLEFVHSVDNKILKWIKS
jgi:hypothetical protein